MSSGIASVEVRKTKKGLEVLAMGRTPRGQKYVKAKKALEAKSPSDPKFKAELDSAIKELFS